MKRSINKRTHAQPNKLAHTNNLLLFLELFAYKKSGIKVIEHKILFIYFCCCGLWYSNTSANNIEFNILLFMNKCVLFFFILFEFVDFRIFLKLTGIS